MLVLAQGRRQPATDGLSSRRGANRTMPPTPANAHAATVLRAVVDQIAARFFQ
jgi:hypothetical protein